MSYEDYIHVEGQDKNNMMLSSIAVQDYMIFFSSALRIIQKMYVLTTVVWLCKQCNYHKVWDAVKMNNYLRMEVIQDSWCTDVVFSLVLYKDYNNLQSAHWNNNGNHCHDS